MFFRTFLVTKLLLILLAGMMTSAGFAQTPLSPDAERALKLGDQFQECFGCPTMVAVPAGSFVMGSPSDETGRLANEGPQHRVTISQPFAVGRVTVTFAEWNACVSDRSCEGVRTSSMGPVDLVSWEDANVYLAWLSRKTGRPYRLLSEAEFEYAARAGNEAAYPWGDEIGQNNANCNGCGSAWDNRLPTMGGSFAANTFGLNDMVGNIFQWVQDCYHGDYNGAPTDGSAWTDGNCSARVIRGGAWYAPPTVPPLRQPRQLCERSVERGRHSGCKDADPWRRGREWPGFSEVHRRGICSKAQTAETQGGVQGMHDLSRNGRGAGRQLHDGRTG
jgi:formylglycine-generating enzyme required for sulfatase activity